MSGSEKTKVSLIPDSAEVDSSVSEIADAMETLKQLAEELKLAFLESFESLADCIHSVSAEISEMGAALDAATIAMSEMIAAPQANGGLFEGILAGIGSVIGLSATIDELEDFFKKYDRLTDAIEIEGNTLKNIFSSVLPETTDEIADFFEVLGEGVQKAIGGIRFLFSNMSFGWGTIVALIIAAIAILIGNWDTVKAAIMSLWEGYLKPFWDRISACVLSIGNSLMTIWNAVLVPIIDWIRQVLEPATLTILNIIMDVIGVALGFVTDAIGGIMIALDGIIQFIAGVFAGDWAMAWEGIVKVFTGLFETIGVVVKGVVNVIITAINVLIGAIYSLIAGVVNGIGGIVNVIGNIVGEDWGFSVPTTPPHIPLLAQGAVLPANKPFLAMVGDQKHGTNVEAPLSTIQEAVAVVMEDMIASNLAGQEAIIVVLKDILEAVLGIEIGDDVIGRAAERYNIKIATVRGCAH